MKTGKEIQKKIFFDDYNSLKKLLDYYHFKEDYSYYKNKMYKLEFEYISIIINVSSPEENKSPRVFYKFPVKMNIRN